MQVDILAFGAHPDDVELGCAGTLSLSAEQGKSIAITRRPTAKYSKYFNGDVKYFECLSGAFIKRPTDEDNNS